MCTEKFTSEESEDGRVQLQLAVAMATLTAFSQLNARSFNFNEGEICSTIFGSAGLSFGPRSDPPEGFMINQPCIAATLTEGRTNTTKNIFLADTW